MAAPFPVALVGVGVYVHLSAPPGILRWMLLGLLCTAVVQALGQHAGGAALGGFAGGVTAALVAALVHRLPHGPPSLSVFLPSFWLLVPGSLGVVTATQVATAGAEGFATAAKLGVDLDALADVLSAGGANGRMWQMMEPWIRSGDDSHLRGPLRIAAKDVRTETMDVADSALLTVRASDVQMRDCATVAVIAERVTQRQSSTVFLLARRVDGDVRAVFTPAAAFGLALGVVVGIWIIRRVRAGARRLLG